jgi:nucleoside-diphosphate-sugar epimerase
MRILVTGHKGYVGSVLVGMLTELGHDVAGCDVEFFRGATFGQETEQQIPELKIDIRDLEQPDLGSPDAVIHLAGLCNDPLGEMNPKLTFDINRLAAVRLARIAKLSGVTRFVFASSCSNYGAQGNGWIDEESSLKPVTAYAESKVLAEKDMRCLGDDHFSPVFLRCGTVYGVSPRLRFDLVLNNLVAWAATTGRVFLKSDGSSWRPVVHVEDVCRAFAAVVGAPRELIHNEVFNVGRTEENYRIRELAEIVVDRIPASRIEYSEQPSRDIRSYRVNCDKIRRILPDFCPSWDAAKGVEQLRAAYDCVQFDLADFEGPRFHRLKHLSALIEEGQIDPALRWRSRS